MTSLFSKRVENEKETVLALADKIFLEITAPFEKRGLTIKPDQTVDLFDISQAESFYLDGNRVSLEFFECDSIFKVLFGDYEPRLSPFFRETIIQVFSRKLSQTHRVKRLVRKKANETPPPILTQLRNSINTIFKYWNNCLDVVFQFMEENQNFKNRSMESDQIIQISLILANSFLGGRNRDFEDFNWPTISEIMKKTVEAAENQLEKLAGGEKRKIFSRLLYCSIYRPFFQSQCGTVDAPPHIANANNVDIFVSGLSYIAENCREKNLTYGDNDLISHRPGIGVYPRELASSCPDLRAKFFQDRIVESSKGNRVVAHDAWSEYVLDRSKLEPLVQIGIHVRGKHDGLDLDIPMLRDIYGM